jgi:hypothetical protein
VEQDSLSGVAENEGPKLGAFGLTGARGLDKFARPHGKEVGSNEEVYCVFIQVCPDMPGPGKSPKAAQ